MPEYSCGVNVQTNVTMADVPSLSRFAWALGICDWPDKTAQMLAVLDAAGVPVKVLRFMQDPRKWPGWPAEYVKRCSLGLFGNEPDIEGLPEWFVDAHLVWIQAGGKIAEPAYHNDGDRISSTIYDVTTAHCYAGDFTNLDLVRSRANGRPILITEYARQGNQEQCLVDLANAGVDPSTVALFAFRWSGQGSQPGYDLADIDLEAPTLVDPYPTKAQFDYLVQGTYNLAKAVDAFNRNAPADGSKALQDAKTNINAINPDELTFS